MTVDSPADAELPALSVKVDAEPAGLGLNEAVTPLGSPEAEKLTVPVKPLLGFTVMVLVLLLP